MTADHSRNRTARRLAFEVKSATVRRGAGRLYRELLAHERLPLEQLTALHDQRASAIAAFAAAHTAYYRDRYREAGITAADLRDPAAWTSLPIIERTDAKTHRDAFYSDEANPRSVRPALTGGSTGQPLKLAQDSRVPLSALTWRMYGWWGVAPWDDLARVGRWSTGPKALAKDVLQWWPTRHTYLEAGKITSESMDRFLGLAGRRSPALLEGYVGAMLEIADHVEAHGVRLPTLRALATTAAPLTEPARARLSAVFQVPVYDEYRSAEVAWMAGECAAHSGLHVFADLRRIEVVGPSGEPVAPGEEGDLVLTDLTNRVFPLVRYRLGDRGVLLSEPCPCGVTLPLMKPPQGRVSDLLRTPDGTAAAHRLNGMFASEPDAVHRFQIHQSADYTVHLRVVLNAAYPRASAAVDDAARELQERLGPTVQVVVEHVDEIVSRNGKLQIISSDIP